MKKITAIFTVLMMLAASSAFAAVTVEAPAGLVNATKFFTGFQVNATGLTNINNKAVNSTMAIYNSTNDGFYSNGTATSTNTLSLAAKGHTAAGIAPRNATYSIYNGTWTTYHTNGSKSAVNYGAGEANQWLLNQSFGDIQGVTVMGPYNGTNANTYFASTSGNSFMVGIANATANATTYAERVGYGDGVTASILYDNGTVFGSAFDATWDFYAYGFDTTTSQPGYVVGKVVLGTAGENDNAAVTYTVVEAGAKGTDVASRTYNATTALDGNYIQLVREGGVDLLTNGTINSDRNLITGYALQSDGDKLFVVMAKAGTTLSTSDLTNRAFKLVYSGATHTANASAGMMAFSVDSNLGLDGDFTRVNATLKNAATSNLVDVDLSGYSVALADSSYFNVTQSNMTIYSTDGETVVGQFYGKQTADKTMIVGIYESEETGAQGYHLAFLVPNPAVTAAITAAGVGYQNNKTLATNGLHGLDLNSTAYSQVALRTQWTGIPSDFTPLTDVKGFNATITEAQKGDVYFTFQYKFTGVGDSIDHLRLYKVFPNAAKTVRQYTYASAASPAAEGSWWISTDVADGYLNENSVLAPATEYYVNYVVKSNGDYDFKSTDKQQIGDPVVLGSVPGSSSSSSSGCVFNPAAGFGLEWLLLMLAPMVAIVRSRFK